MVLLEQRLAPLQQQHARHEQGPHHRVQNMFGSDSSQKTALFDRYKHLVSSLFTLRDNEDLSDRNMM